MPRSCGIAGCKKQPYWGVAGETPKFCFLHKAPEHIDVRNKRCEVQTCDIRPHYGYDGEAPRFCAQHKAEGMHNLRSKRCQSEDCPKYASCGPPGGAPMLCSTHKEDGMVNLIGRRCSRLDCDTYASYGVAGTRPRYCARHREEDMVNLTVKKCETDGCLMQPNFNFDGQRKARFCHKHAHDGMVDVLDRRCAERGCDRQPIYGNTGEMSGRPTWCPVHRPDSSYDVKTARCQESGCQKHPSYGYDHDRIRRRCRLHKLSDMLDVKSPRCEFLECKKQPCCGHLGAKARFCSEHKQEGMVNLKTRAFRCKHRGLELAEQDVVTTHAHGVIRRKYTHCNRACRFAFPNEPAKYCGKHAEEGMVDVLNPQCGMDDCLELPTHGYDGEQPTFCLRHMAEGMKVIVPQKANVLHWSSETRKQAEATAREASRIFSERVAGSAKVIPLPPKKDPDKQLKVKRAHANANASRAGTSARMPASLTSCGSARVTPMVLGEDPANHSITADDVALAFGSQEPLQIGESPPRKTGNSAFATNTIASAALSAAVSAATSAAAAAAAAAANAGESGTGGDSSIPASTSSPAAFSEIASAIDVGVRAGMGVMGVIDPVRGAVMGELMGYGRLPPLPSPLPIPSPVLPAPLQPTSAIPPAPALPPPFSNATVHATSATPAPAVTVAPLPVSPLEISAPTTPGAYGGVSSFAQPNTIPPAAPAAPEEAAVAENGSAAPLEVLASAPPVTPPPPPPALVMLTAPPSVGVDAPSGASSAEGVPSAFPPEGNAAGVSPAESLCASGGCTVVAKFGHPKLGKGATHCLVHCEAGMHRLAPDMEQWPITSPALDPAPAFVQVSALAPASAVGSKRARPASPAEAVEAAAAAVASAVAAASTLAPEATEAEDAYPPGVSLESAALSRKRKMITRSTTRAKDGMMLLAGAVTASRSQQAHDN